MPRRPGYLRGNAPERIALGLGALATAGLCAWLWHAPAWAALAPLGVLAGMAAALWALRRLRAGAQPIGRLAALLRAVMILNGLLLLALLALLSFAMQRRELHVHEAQAAHDLTGILMEGASGAMALLIPWQAALALPLLPARPRLALGGLAATALLALPGLAALFLGPAIPPAGH